jgi:hypothetical protein
MNQPTNQRRESRLEADTPVTVKVLKILGEPAISCKVIDMSGSGLRISAPNPIPCGAEVTVESSESAIYAEVCRCEEQDGAYSIGLMISELRPR